MDCIDRTLRSMKQETKELLRKNLDKYRTTGDAAAKRQVLLILSEHDDAAAVRRFIREL